MTTQDRNRLDLWNAPTKVIPQARRLRALMPPLTPDVRQRIAEDPDATVLLSFGPETISARRLGLQPGTGRSAIPLNSRAYCDVSPEVTAYREGYSDGFVDSTTLRSERP